MGSVENIGPYIAPLRKSVVVRRAPAEAFEIFTGRLASWWPLSRYSIFQADAVTCAIEPRVGGEVFETSSDGARGTWGTVLVWEPPQRFAMSWHPGREAATAQEVEVRFVPVAEGTRVELEHRGWAVVFERLYAEACS